MPEYPLHLLIIHQGLVLRVVRLARKEDISPLLFMLNQPLTLCIRNMDIELWPAAEVMPAEHTGRHALDREGHVVIEYVVLFIGSLQDLVFTA